MGVQCVAYGCNSNNTLDKNLSFHRFPHKRPEVLKQWIDAIGRVNWQPTEYSKLCSYHFGKNAYSVIPGADKKQLKKTAVPSVFSFKDDKRGKLERISSATASAAKEQHQPEAEMHEFTAEQNSPPLDFTKICRLCLVDDEELYPVFERKLQSKLQKLSLNVQFEEGDELPQQVCQQCIQHINSSYYFKLQCQRSCTSLMQQLNSRKQKELPTAAQQQRDQNVTNNSVEEMEKDTADAEGEIPPKEVEEEEEEEEEEKEEEELNGIEENSDVENQQEPNNQHPFVVIGEVEETSKNINQESLEMFVTNYTHLSPKELLRSKLNLLPRVHTCDVCGRSFRTRGSLKQHMKSHLGSKPVYQCEQCNKMYPNAAKLREHMSAVHAEKKPFSCNLCGRDFPYKSTLKMHIRVHTGEKSFKCETCDKSFGQKHNLEEHRVVHTNERPFVCDICGMRYRQIRNLKTHQETHLGLPKAPKPIKHWCNYCGRGFNAMANFQRHLLTHTGEKAFACELCEKQFATKAKMLKHKQTHTNERPFVCAVCNKTFKVKEGLTRHIQVQHNPNPENLYSCDTCKVSFSKRSFLNKHMRYVHYQDKQYSCPICERIYFQKHYVKLHIKNMHKIDPETVTIEERNNASDSDK